MNYADNAFKFVLVLNKKHDVPRLLNAALHLVAGLVGRADEGERNRMRFLHYRDADGRTRARHCYPFIALEAKNSNQLRTLCQEAAKAGVAHADFVDTMLGSSAADQLATAAGRDESFDILACCLWGPHEVTTRSRGASRCSGTRSAR